MAHHRQAEARSAAGAAAASVDPVEALENAVQILARYPDSTVADLDSDVTVGLCDSNRDLPTIGVGELDRVVQQIEDRRGELTTVAAHQEIPVRQSDLDPDVALCRSRPNPVMGAAHHVSDDDFGELGVVAVFNSAEFEQVVDRVGEPFRLDTQSISQ